MREDMQIAMHMLMHNLVKFNQNSAQNNQQSLSVNNISWYLVKFQPNLSQNAVRMQSNHLSSAFLLLEFLTEEMIKDYEKRCLKDIEKEKDDNWK